MKKFVVLLLVLGMFPLYVLAGSGLVEDYIDIADSLAKNGKYNEALTYIEKSLAIEPQNAKLIEMKTDLLKISGKGSVPSILSKFESDNEDFTVAEKFRFMGEDNKAIALYQKCIAQNTNFAPAYLGLAVSLYEVKNFAEAKNTLNTYLNLMPKSDFGYFLRAKSNMNIGETQSALRDIKSAQAISNNIEYQLIEAIILCEMGKYSQSRDILNQVSDKIQTYSVYKYLGICDSKLGNYKSAVMNLERAILLFDEDKTIMPIYNEAKRMSGN